MLKIGDQVIGLHIGERRPDDTARPAAAPFARGDHLRSPRTGYTHHGICIGDGLVIHYAGFAREMASGAIEIASLDEFAGGNPVEVVPHPSRRHSRSESVDRAFRRLGEDWYNLVLNNCEHFVNWCIDGEHASPQVARAAHVLMPPGFVASAGVASTGIAPACAMVLTGPLGIASGAVGLMAGWLLD